MKLTIERTALLRALTHVHSVVERRSTIPILSNMFLKAENNGVSLTATDMDIAIVERIAAEIEQPGAITAPAHILYDIVRKLPDGAQIYLDAASESGRLILSSGRSRFTLQTLPVEDFPAMGEDNLSREFNLEASVLRRLIDCTRFAISTEETRYYLNGVYLHATQDKAAKLRVVATDGHRLARIETPLPEGAAQMPGIIVPRKTVLELRKLIEETDSDIRISLSETKIRFSFGQAILTSKLIDGTFPDYERVIPTENDKILSVEREAFVAAVDRVSIIATERMRAVKISIDGSGKITLAATGQDNGTAVEEVEVSYTHEPMDIGFNSKYLLDVTQQIDDEKVEFHFADPSSPMIVRDPSDTSSLYVLMPMLM